MSEVLVTCDPKAREAALARVVQAQHGAVSARQLGSLSFNASWIKRAVRSGRLTRVHQGVYVVGLPTGTIEQRCAAARLAGGRRSVVSHQSAAALLGIMRDRPGPIHLTLPRSRKSRPGLHFHQSTLRVVDTVVHDGIRTTSALRTIADLRRVLTGDALERAMSEAHRLGLVDRHDLPVHHRMTRSQLERAFLTAIRAAGDIPEPETNEQLLGYEADFYWPDHGVVVEIDHYATHGDRLAFERDRRKRNAYTLAGLIVLQVTEETLPGAVDAVRAALGRRRP